MRIIGNQPEYFRIVKFVLDNDGATVKDYHNLMTKEMTPVTWSALKQKFQFLDGSKEGISLFTYEKKWKEKKYFFDVNLFLQEFSKFYVKRLSKVTLAILKKYLSTFPEGQMLGVEEAIKGISENEILGQLIEFFPDVEETEKEFSEYSFHLELMKKLFDFYDKNTQEKSLNGLFNFLADLVPLIDFIRNIKL